MSVPGKRDGEEVGKTRAAITCVKLRCGFTFPFRGRRNGHHGRARTESSFPQRSTSRFVFFFLLSRSIFLRRSLFFSFSSPLHLSVSVSIRTEGPDWDSTSNDFSSFSSFFVLLLQLVPSECKYYFFYSIVRFYQISFSLQLLLSF